MADGDERIGQTSLGGVLPRLRSRLGGKPAPILHLAAVWSDIVGAELARQSRPEKLTVRRTKASTNAGSANAGAGGTLSLRCTGAAALELQHRIPQIVERTNAFFGFTAVAKVTFVQGPLPAARTTRTTLPRPVDRPTRDAMVRATEKVQSPELKAALQRLAAAVANDPGPTEK